MIAYDEYTEIYAIVKTHSSILTLSCTNIDALLFFVPGISSKKTALKRTLFNSCFP